jgi:hypothetical protein
MKNKELAKGNYDIYLFAIDNFQILLANNTSVLDFQYKFDRGVFNSMHNENLTADGFIVWQYFVDRKMGIENYIDLDKRIKTKFGFENLITMICDHNFDGGEFSLVFRQAFFIGKDGLLHTFDSLENLTNKIRQILYE